MKKKGSKGFGPETIFRLVGFAFFAYLFFGFMLLPCLNTLTSIFTTKNARRGGGPLGGGPVFLCR